MISERGGSAVSAWPAARRVVDSGCCPESAISCSYSGRKQTGTLGQRPACGGV